MGSAMGQSPEITHEVVKWVKEVARVPVWAKMTPNITDITAPARAAAEAGADGISAINTILSIIGVDLESLRPQPTVEGFTVPGGYSAQAVRPIALRHVMEVGRTFFGKGNVTISGIGGVENAHDAIQFMLLGAQTVQICTGAMLRGFEIIDELTRELEAWMEKKGFAKLEDFIGHSLQFFSTHANLVELQRQAKRARAGQASRDDDWSGDKITEQTKALMTE
jgi:dihydroorotate dehydrogenase subfamily 1